MFLSYTGTVDDRLNPTKVQFSFNKGATGTVWRVKKNITFYCNEAFSTRKRQHLHCLTTWQHPKSVTMSHHDMIQYRSTARAYLQVRSVAAASVFRKHTVVATNDQCDARKIQFHDLDLSVCQIFSRFPTCLSAAVWKDFNVKLWTGTLWSERILYENTLNFTVLEKKPQLSISLHYIYYIVKSTLPFIYIYTLYSCNFLFKQDQLLIYLSVPYNK